MTLQDLGNLGEILGSIAVVVTLIYLARQIHQSTEASRHESLNTALGTHVFQIADLTATDEAAELFRRFCSDFHALSLNEKGRIHSALLKRLASFNQVARLHEAGLLDDDEFEAMQGTYISILRTPGGRAWWETYRNMTPKNLNAYITTAIDDPGITRKTIIEEQPWLFEPRDEQP